MNIHNILEGIQKPARYTGGEHNSVKKDWDRARVKLCISYPDIYEVGMSFLGLQILYSLVNKEEEFICERVFSPWPDMEERLRKTGTRLFSLESRKALKDFDVVGFSLGYELTFTNILNMLDLGGIPVLSKDRDTSDPIVIAGGTCAFNPLPLEDFIDIFFIGDAEESLVEFLRLAASLKGEGAGRNEIIRKAQDMEGVYVPRQNGSRPHVRKRIIRDLDGLFYPVKLLVPYIQVVHDRVALEIMRGCPNNCRFCQARVLYHPARIRKAENVLNIAVDTLKATGYDEISLLSLSSANHKDLAAIIQKLNEVFHGRGINISVPSLRVEDLCKEIPSFIAQNRKTGMTFAPEAGSPRIRKMINKELDTVKFFDALKAVYKAGWRKVKLYFMIGFPSETEDDLKGIAELSQKVSEIGREVDGRARDVTLSINSFIPKPHTAFQWFGMEKPEVLYAKQEFLRNTIKNKKIKIDFHDVNISLLEAAISRGDALAGRAIMNAWKKGARLDAWREFFYFSIWESAFAEAGISVRDAARKSYKIEEDLPWEFIEPGISKERLASEYLDAVAQ